MIQKSKKKLQHNSYFTKKNSDPIMYLSMARYGLFLSSLCVAEHQGKVLFSAVVTD